MSWAALFLVKQAVNVTRALMRSPAARMRLAAAPGMHAGKGTVASSSSSITTRPPPADIPMQRRLTQQLRERGLASRWENLPPLQNDYVRLIHRTNARSANNIVAGGGNLRSKAGPWDSTATSHFTDAMPNLTELSAKGDPRFNVHGNRAMVYDVPNDVHRAQRTAMGVDLPGRYLVGATDLGQSRKAMALGLGNKVGPRPGAPQALPEELIRQQAFPSFSRRGQGAQSGPVDVPAPPPPGPSSEPTIW
jgi:hypothetical protein